ncbi:hypothetical protein AB0C24_31095 [Amycolatopsis japonica]
MITAPAGRESGRSHSGRKTALWGLSVGRACWSRVELGDHTDAEVTAG